MQIHLELKDPLFSPAIQLPSVLAHCKASRAYALTRVVRRATYPPEAQVELVRLAGHLARAFVAETFADLREMAEAAELGGCCIGAAVGRDERAGAGSVGGEGCLDCAPGVVGRGDDLVARL